MLKILNTPKKIHIKVVILLWLLLPLLFFSGLWILGNRSAFGYAGAGGISIPIFFSQPQEVPIQIQPHVEGEVQEISIVEIPTVQTNTLSSDRKEIIIQGQDGLRNSMVIEGGGNQSAPQNILLKSQGRDIVKDSRKKNSLAQPIVFSKKFDAKEIQLARTSSAPARMLFSVKTQLKKTIKFFKRIGARTVTF